MTSLRGIFVSESTFYEFIPCDLLKMFLFFKFMHQSVESPAPPYPGNAGHQRGILAVFSGHLCPNVRGVRQHQTQITATGDCQRGFGGDFAFEAILTTYFIDMYNFSATFLFHRGWEYIFCSPKHNKLCTKVRANHVSI